MRQLAFMVGVAFVGAVGLSSLAEPANGNAIENEPPYFTVCPYGEQRTVAAFTTKDQVFIVFDPDGDPLEVTLIDDGSVVGDVHLEDQGGGQWACFFTPDLADAWFHSQPIEMLVEVSDGVGGETCMLSWNVIYGSPFLASVATPLEEVPATPVPGTPISVNVWFERVDLVGVIHSFNFLIGWDTTQLTFLQAVPGPLFAIPGTHEWEQFEYAIVDDCIGDCAGGLVQVAAIANVDGDGHEPTSMTLEQLSVPFVLDFETVDGAVFGGPFVPVQFFWTGCDDNSMEFAADWTEPPGQIVQGTGGGVYNAQSELFEYMGSANVFPSFYNPQYLCRDEEPPWEVITWIDFISAFPANWFQMPVAYIDNITPNPATPEESISFVGHGTDPDGDETVVGYEWRSDIDGMLSTEASFDSDLLSPGQHKISFRVRDINENWSRAFTALLAINQTPNTPVGSNVPVDLSPDISIIFESVTQAGFTEVTVTPDGPAPPGSVGIVPLGSATYYDIQTTAVYTGNIEICITYDEVEVTGDESALVMLHYTDGEWTDITSSHDLLGNVICGLTPSLSFLVLAEPCCDSRVGDANFSGGDEPTIGDISVMIDAKFITGVCNGIIACLAEADVNQSGGIDPTCDDITIGDISILIDYLFITGPSLGLPSCL